MDFVADFEFPIKLNEENSATNLQSVSETAMHCGSISVQKIVHQKSGWRIHSIQQRVIPPQYCPLWSRTQRSK